jgi:multiple sugar transport system substrate-binding protein
MTRLRRLARSVLWIWGLAFCASLVVGTVTPNVGAQGNTITVLTVEDPFFFALQKVLPQFEQQTGIHVNLEAVAYDALHARAVNSFIGHQAGVDVITVDQMWTSEWANNGWLVPLDDLIKKDADTVKPQDFIPAVIYSMNEWMGHIFTLPVAAYGQFVLYRTDVFKALGLMPPPADPAMASGWTWSKYLEEIESVNGKTVAGQKMYGTVIVGAQPAPITHMYTELAASMGARWFKQFPAGSPWNFQPMLNSPENVAALQYYVTLYKYSPPESVNYVWFDAGTAFSKGNIGMFYWWTPYAYLVRKAGYMAEKDSPVVGKYGVGLMPQEPGKTQVYSAGGWSLGLNNYSANKDAAWKFIVWATGAKAQREMGLVGMKLFSDFPRASLYDDPELKQIYPYLPTQLYVLQNGNGKITRPPIPLYFTLEGLYGLQLNRAVAGKATPEEALTTAQQQFEAILKNNLFIPKWLQASYNDTLVNTRKLLQSIR